MPGKILWLRKYRPEIYESAAKYVSIKEYVLKRLTGEWVADYGIASGGGLLNLNDRQWDRELLDVIGISPARLSRLVDGSTLVRMLPDAVRNIGADIPLVVGSGDGQLANLGAGALGSGHFVATIGSSGAIRVFSPEPILDQRQRTFCYRLDADTCLAGGAINNGGLVLNWLIENCFKNEATMAGRGKRDIYDILNDYARDIPAGSNGLLFLPFLTGTRSPDWNSKARGLILGLSMSHSHKALVRAAMEGIVMRLYANFLILRELIGDGEAVIVNGGFTRSRVWLQIMADIFDSRLLLYENTVDSTLGAVIMGFKAISRIDTYEQMDLKLPLKETVAPEVRNTATYRDLYRLHEEAYACNMHLFEKLYQFRQDHADENTNHPKIIL
jgi:gluconokinase